jgi:hypothetical protein
MAGVLSFSITPTIIGTFLGSIVFFLLKEKKNRNLSILLIMLHILPFFFVSFDFTAKDIIINILIFILYLISLKLQGTNMIQEYSKLDIDKPIGKYYKDLFSPVDLYTQTLKMFDKDCFVKRNSRTV